MQPTLVSGDLIIATRFFKNFIKKNSLIVFYDKYHSYIVKRVAFRKAFTVILKNDNVNTNSIFSQKPINLNNETYIVLLKIDIRLFLKKLKLKIIKFSSYGNL